MFRKLVHRVAQKIASHVEKNNLFDQSEDVELYSSPSNDALPPKPVEQKTSLDSLPSSPDCIGASALDIQGILRSNSAWLVVNHWATWCEPCIEELPLLRDLASKLPPSSKMMGISWENFVNGGLSIEDLSEEVRLSIRSHGLTWPSMMVTSEPSSFFESLKIEWERVPQTWVIAPNGQRELTIEGVLSPEQVNQIIDLIPG